MDELLAALSGLVRMATAVLALWAVIEAKRNRIQGDRIENELYSNPKKSAIETIKRLNGNAPPKIEGIGEQYPPTIP